MKASLIRPVKGVDGLGNFKSLSQFVANFHKDIEKFKRGEEP